MNWPDCVQTNASQQLLLQLSQWYINWAFTVSCQLNDSVRCHDELQAQSTDIISIKRHTDWFLCYPNAWNGLHTSVNTESKPLLLHILKSFWLICICIQECKEAPVDATVISLQRITRVLHTGSRTRSGRSGKLQCTVCILVSCLFSCRRMLPPPPTAAADHETIV